MALSKYLKAGQTKMARKVKKLLPETNTIRGSMDTHFFLPEKKTMEDYPTDFYGVLLD